MAQRDDAEERKRGEADAASGGKDQRQGKQHSISDKGRSASAASSGRYQGSSGRSREDEDLKSVSSQADSSDKDLEEISEEEISGNRVDSIESASYSDTDEDENEGLGDGNLGRTVRGGFEG